MDQILRDQAFLPGPPKMLEFMHGVVDFRPQNVIAFFQYKDEFERHPEDSLHGAAMKLLLGNGASGDKPAIQKLVHSSLGHKPELLHLYNRS